MGPDARPGQGAKYQQVADRIRARIQSGELRSGQALPTENQLAASYRVSRPTVRAALAVLRAEGLIESQQGRGAFVRLRAPARRVPPPKLPEAAPPDGPERATGGTAEQIIEAGPAPVLGEVADILGVPEGAQAFVRRRLITEHDGDPVKLEADYFPFSQKPSGARPDRTASMISARMPTPAEARTLRMQPGVPLLVMLVASYDRDGDPVQVMETMWPADRYVIYDEQPSGRATSAKGSTRGNDPSDSRH